tara:strand:+ start:4542 stop:5204 length:663 start_codon:yes stop_codon:yes gene_type:complete
MIEFISRLIALFLTFMLFPFLILTGLFLFLIQGKPIFFTQNRVGFKFKEFRLMKFRTMYLNDQKKMITDYNDNRITAIGKILRKFKIDELPQLINIILGDMRFIGPRPEVPKFVTYDKFSFLNEVKPGLSDFSSIIFRNEEHILSKLNCDNPYKKILPLKIRLAEIYSKNKSFRLDLLLTFLTIISIFNVKITLRLVIENILPMYDSDVKNNLIEFFRQL